MNQSQHPRQLWYDHQSKVSRRLLCSQGKVLFNNATAGTVVNNQTLELHDINRARAGIYTCVGSNQEGDGESNAVVLDIKCEYNMIKS